MTTPIARPETAAPLIVRAGRGESVERVPVWLMRQAGRYLPEYKAVRATSDFLTMCKTPDLASEVSVQPVEIVGADAVIIFSDILIPLEAMGVPLAFPEDGPKLEPVTDGAGVAKLIVPDAQKTCGFLGDAIAMTHEKLKTRVGLRETVPGGPSERTGVIGFGGAPFTLLTYVVEGKTSKEHRGTKKFLYTQPDAARALLDLLVETLVDYLAMQIRAGADMVQLFDSWAGALSPEDYAQFALDPTRRVVQRLKNHDDPRVRATPVVSFVNGVAGVIEQAATSGADVLGVDWRIDLGDARRRIGALSQGAPVLQGNLDPAMLLAPIEVAEAAVERMMTRQREALRALDPARSEACGHIFNLGHGIFPEVPWQNVKALVDGVKRHGAA